MTESPQGEKALRANTARLVRRSRVLDEALRARWLQLIPAMSRSQLLELRSALAESEAKLDALDGPTSKR